MRSLHIQDLETGQLTLSNDTVPEPAQIQDLGQNLVRIRFEAIGLNRADLLYPQGRYFFKPEINSRMGFEGAGTIDAAGPGLEHLIGRKAALCPMSFDVIKQGSISEYGLYTESQIILLPDDISTLSASACWMAYLTAWGGLIDAGNMKAGEYAVITAASSSVGIAALQTCKQFGAIPIATTTSQDKAEQLKALGAEHVIVQDKSPEGIDHYVSEVRRITGDKGSDLVFDAVAGPATKGLIKASKREGRIIFHGLLDRRPTDIHVGVLMKRLLTIKGYTLDQTLENSETKEKAIASILDGLSSDMLCPVVASTYTLVDYESAFEELKSNTHIGKIVLTP